MYITLPSRQMMTGSFLTLRGFLTESPSGSKKYHQDLPPVIGIITVTIARSISTVAAVLM